MGVFSNRDSSLSEAQVINSQKYVTAGFTYKLIEKCGHFIQLDKPDELLEAILGYYNS
jgi:pimeloyl-ACP methyl ester carboxylesterase